MEQLIVKKDKTVLYVGIIIALLVLCAFLFFRNKPAQPTNQVIEDSIKVLNTHIATLQDSVQRNDENYRTFTDSVLKIINNSEWKIRQTTIIREKFIDSIIKHSGWADKLRRVDSFLRVPHYK